MFPILLRTKILSMTNTDQYDHDNSITTNTDQYDPVGLAAGL